MFENIVEVIHCFDTRAKVMDKAKMMKLKIVQQAEAKDSRIKPVGLYEILKVNEEITPFYYPMLQIEE